MKKEIKQIVDMQEIDKGTIIEVNKISEDTIYEFAETYDLDFDVAANALIEAGMKYISQIEMDKTKE